ncbi:protein GLUTAMINE DUMPER 6-like [Amaranthus tricolor]|uniref:protein GLUTAMINE DUMPER 6-like n=1 Tax=Amaranthus tricolor TaxID=29722 RepID=UPI00258E1E23|nr:protein GLUTAMINE DUMPER 6-like [Amaranthus tricolor]
MTSPNSSSSTEIMRWNSPIPYLFGGLALMLGLISIALIILACSDRKKNSSSSSSSIDVEKPVIIDNMVDLDVPKIAVIMAGNDNPTCIAIPTTTVSATAQGGHMNSSLPA